MRTERGQVLPMAGLLMCVMVGVVVLLGYVTTSLTNASRAQTAADAAALAGASSGRLAAERAAAANHASLVYFQTTGADTEVKTHVGDAEKTAHARREGLSSTISR